MPDADFSDQAAVSPDYTREVKDLAANPLVRNSFQIIEGLDEWALERLVELNEIPAPTFMEEERGRRFAELLAECGADSVWTDAEGNVFGRRPGRRGERTVALGGHLDTAFPAGTDVTVRRRGDTLFAPGIGDNTRGLVVVLAVLRALEEAGIETDDDVVFVGVVGEEGLGDLRGIKHIYRDPAAGPDAWIEVDGGELAALVTMGLGSVRYRITFRGPGGHSWRAFGLANPAHAMSRAVRRFQDAADALARSGPRTSHNVGRIGGGTSVTAIPTSRGDWTGRGRVGSAFAGRVLGERGRAPRHPDGAAAGGGGRFGGHDRQARRCPPESRPGAPVTPPAPTGPTPRRSRTRTPWPRGFRCHPSR